MTGSSNTTNKACAIGGYPRVASYEMLGGQFVAYLNGERNPLFYIGFVSVDAGGRIHFMFLESSLATSRHLALSMLSFFSSMCSSMCLFVSYLVDHHYPFSKHAYTIALHSPWLVYLKYPLNPTNLSSWLLSLINLTPHFAFITAFSVRLKLLTHSMTPCLAFI